MNTEELMRSRRTVHEYKPEPVDAAVLRKALELALWAPNHKHTHPWRFTVAGPLVRSQLADLSVAIKEKKKGKTFADPVRESLRAKVLNPGALVVVRQPKVEDAIQAREDYAAIACGLQNAMLFLWEHGYGSKWSSGGLTRHAKTYELVKLNPEQEEIIGFLWVGRAAHEESAPPRPRLDDILISIP